MKEVCFLCTGNSCRSQIAEEYAEALLKGKYEVQSARIETRGLNPDAAKVMVEDDIGISNQSSRPIDPDYLNAANLVIALCGNARGRCPVLFPHSRSIHRPLPDPTHVEGTDEQKLAIFRQVRNEIREHISKLN